MFFFFGYQHRWIWVIHGSPIPRSQMSGILRWTVIENMALKYGPWSFGGSRGHLETIWLASITATVSTVSHGFQREPSIWLTQVVWVFGLTCENRCTVFANPGIMQRKRDEKSGTNVSTNVLSYSFYDSRVQLVALGGMSNMLNTGFLRQVAHLRLSLAILTSQCMRKFLARENSRVLLRQMLWPCVQICQESLRTVALGGMKWDPLSSIFVSTRAIKTAGFMILRNSMWIIRHLDWFVFLRPQLDITCGPLPNPQSNRCTVPTFASSQSLQIPRRIGPEVDYQPSFPPSNYVHHYISSFHRG